jgi:hypothetical protein
MEDAHVVREWVVLMEAVGAGGIDRPKLARLLRALGGGRHAIGLQGQDRYALQVRANGCTPGEALSEVFARWSDAVVQLELSGWEFVRGEVLTLDEFESELRMAETPRPGRPGPRLCG